jgi:hypothetical protein
VPCTRCLTFGPTSDSDRVERGRDCVEPSSNIPSLIPVIRLRCCYMTWQGRRSHNERVTLSRPSSTLSTASRSPSGSTMPTSRSGACALAEGRGSGEPAGDQRGRVRSSAMPASCERSFSATRSRRNQARMDGGVPDPPDAGDRRCTSRFWAIDGHVLVADTPGVGRGVWSSWDLSREPFVHRKWARKRSWSGKS